MAYRMVYSVTVYWVGPGLGVMGGQLAPSLPNVPAGGAQSIEFENVSGGQNSLTFTGTDITNLTNAMAADIAAQCNANIARVQGFSTGTG